MRKLLLTFLVTAFMMPAVPAMAACNSKATDPTDPDACAFEQPKAQAVENDKIEIPVTDDKGNVTKYKPEIWKKLDADAATKNAMRSGGCNPVAFALLQQEGNLAMNKEVMAKAEVSKVIDVRDNLCYQMGRDELINPVREQAKTVNDEFMGWFAGLFGGGEGKKILEAAVKYNVLPMPGDILEAKANELIDQQCMQVDNIQSNIIQNMNGRFGATVMNGMSDQGFFAIRYDNGSTKPPVNSQTTKNGGGNGDGASNAVRLPAAQKQQPRAQQPAAKPAAPAQPQQNQQQAPAPKRNIYQ